MSNKTAVNFIRDNYSIKMTLREIKELINKAELIEHKQHLDTWESAHQAGRFEGKGIAENNWQTFESYWSENFKK